ncbi:MAG: primosomal protein N' [Myxococcota bacterium]|nr:primosomal protein N' [Myxococcota bacterium]
MQDRSGESGARPGPLSSRRRSGPAIDSPQERIAELAIPLPLPGRFHYRVPQEIDADLKVGQAVCVPFGRRRLTGYVLGIGARPPEGVRLRDIIEIQTEEPLFPETLVETYEWISNYYFHPLGEVVRTALPAGTRSASRRVVRLLAAGQDQTLDAGAAEALLDRLRASPRSQLALNTLLRRERVAQRVIRQAERAGWVEVLQEDGRDITRIRTEEFFCLAGSARSARDSFPRRGAVRDRLIDYIGRFGPVSLAEIRDNFPTYGAPLRQLRERSLLVVESRPVDLEAAERVPLSEEDRRAPELTEEQSRCMESIDAALDAKVFGTFLLHGVTGSGKTEVYLRSAARVLQQGGGAILLVPEIGLTPQFLGRFRARFGEQQVAVLHSGLSDRERLDEWMRIQRGEARLVVGPRSAVFAPIENLRLLVVDEEHDGSYKQEEGLRYNARDVAVVRARQAGALCILGSATPSLESVRNVIEGRYGLESLTVRVGGRPLPNIELVDLKNFPVSDPDAPGAALSPPLREAIETNHAEGGQAILLLNRRGFATTVLCTSCGVHFRCSDCDVSMTYHGRRNAVLCHWCGASQPLPSACPACEDPAGLKLVGRGTERIEEEIQALWPEIRVDRMDADTTRSRSGHRRILDRFRSGEVDMLIGTQMVAKGHDFPRVTLVGVLHADAALHLPDFRASERTFQLVAQVAGRAGRGQRPGRVLVQTWHPDHHAIRLALDHDFESFSSRELRFRKGLWYPPYARLALLKISASQEREAASLARRVRGCIDVAGGRAVDGTGQLRVLGPAPAPMYRLKGRFRWQVLVKAADHRVMGRLLHLLDLPSLRTELKGQRGSVRVVLDRDPVSML